MKQTNIIKAAADVDDTVLEANPDFSPDFVSGGVRYVFLKGRLVALNPEFRTTGDTLVNLREAFGSLQDDGEPWGRLWDRQCKLTGVLTFERHLELQFLDALQRITIEEAIEFAARTMRPMKGSIEFLGGLKARSITTAFVTNGADAIAGPVLKQFFGSVLDDIPVYANVLRDGIFHGLHGSVGVAKGEVVQSLGNVRFFLGDSKGGDGPGAQAVWDAGGYVFALGHNGPSSLQDYCRNHFGSERWCHLGDYTNALEIVDRHLAMEGN